MDGDTCQDCIVTAGLPIATASSLHAAPQARRPATQLVIRERGGDGNRRPRSAHLCAWGSAPYLRGFRSLELFSS